MLERQLATNKRQQDKVMHKGGPGWVSRAVDLELGFDRIIRALVQALHELEGARRKFQ